MTGLSLLLRTEQIFQAHATLQSQLSKQNKFASTTERSSQNLQLFPSCLTAFISIACHENKIRKDKSQEKWTLAFLRVEIASKQTQKEMLAWLSKVSEK